MSCPPNEPPPLPRPTVFLSYASEDRTAARQVRDALEAAGLDVWYDESELGGGDAWDQKIRGQIRDCDYFLPLISATTERRREGYFRREWRLATERTLDMADDVLFLVPVAIDDTAGAGARVPERFHSVQWVRVPGGEPNAALNALAQRLLQREAPPPPTAAARSAEPRASRTGRRRAPVEDSDPSDAPLPMPPFPKRAPGAQDEVHYFAEIFWWLVNVTRFLFKRLPKAIRILVVVWLGIVLLARCTDNSDPDPTPKKRDAAVAPATSVDDSAGTGTDPAANPDRAAAQLREVAAKFKSTAEQPDTGKLGAGLARVGAEIAEAMSKEIQRQSGVATKPSLAIVPFELGFAATGEATQADSLQEAVQDQWELVRPGSTTVLKIDTNIVPADAVLVTVTAPTGANWILSARPFTLDGARRVEVRVIPATGGAPVWSETFAWPPTDLGPMAGRIVEGLLVAIPVTPAAPPATPTQSSQR